MPKPQPISPAKRQYIANRIRFGAGRNAIARTEGVSPGVVSKIARENGLLFADTKTINATTARQIDQFAIRVERVNEIFDKYFALETTIKPNGTPTRTERRLRYALYNADRLHNGVYNAHGVD